MNPFTVLELAGEPGFIAGVIVGVVLLPVALIAVRHVEPVLVWSVAVMFGTTLVDPRWRTEEPPAWIFPLLASAVILVGFGSHRISAWMTGRQIWTLFGLSVFGAWGALPDTEYVMMALGVTVALSATLVRSQPPSRGAAVASAAMVTAGVSMLDWAGRPSAFVGVAGVFGVLLVAGIVPSSRRVSWPVVIVIHMAMIVWMGRVVAPVGGVAPAAVRAIGGLALFAFGWWMAPRWQARRRDSDVSPGG